MVTISQGIRDRRIRYIERRKSCTKGTGAPWEKGREVKWWESQKSKEGHNHNHRTPKIWEIRRPDVIMNTYRTLKRTNGIHKRTITNDLDKQREDNAKLPMKIKREVKT